MQNTPATSSTAPRIRQAVRTANAKTAPPALPRAPLLHGLNRAVLWQLAACGTGLLLSAGQVYGGAAPFGLGLLLGCGNTYAPAAALGCLAGLLLFQPLDTALKLAGACIGALTARIVGRHLFAARCPAGVCTGAGGGGVLHFVLCLRGQPGAHRRTGSCACHGPDRCRPGALFCRAGRGCGRAWDSGLLPRRAPQRGRRICCRVCAGGAGRPQPARRTHPRSCRRGRATGLSALPGAGSAGGVSAACPIGRHPKPDQRGTQTFRRGRYLIRHCRNSERCMQLPDAAPRRKL